MTKIGDIITLESDEGPICMFCGEEADTPVFEKDTDRQLGWICKECLENPNK